MIGTRGHDLGGVMTAASMAKEAKVKGLDVIQLVTYRSLKGVSNRAGFMSHGFAQSIGWAFQKEGVRIALLGCYINVPHDDLSLFKEYLTYARAYGCSLVGTETGSVNSDYSFNPDNHGQAALEEVINKFREMTAYAEKFGVCVAVEGVHAHIVHTPERMKQLLDSVDAPNLKVIFDPVNLVTPDNYKDIKTIIEKAFSLYGHEIELIHAKDFIMEDGQIRMVALGKGLMDYEHLYRLMACYKYEIEVIIEDYQGEDLEESIQYLKSIEEKRD